MFYSSATATGTPSSLFLRTAVTPSLLLLRRRNLSVLRSENPNKHLRLSASLTDTHPHFSWSSPPPPTDDDHFRGWAFPESPPQSNNNKKGLPKIVIIAGIGTCVTALLAAIAYFLLSRKGFEFRFHSPSSTETTVYDKIETNMSDENAAAASDAAMEGVSDATGITLHKEPAEKLERVKVSVYVDSNQLETLSALKKLKIIEDDVAADELCTRREYARWLLRLNSMLERNQKHRIVPSISLSGSVIAAFDDLGVEDPDFESIQALAESGIIPSKLSRTNSCADSSDGSSFCFYPERFISRQDLISWKAQLEYGFLPGITEQMSKTKVYYMDVKEISSDATPELLTDMLAGDRSIIRKVFGQSRRFQPNKPLTKAQAAVALTSGRMSEAIYNEILRLEAEKSLRQAAVKEIRNEFLERGDIKRFWDEKMNEEKIRGFEVEKLYIAALHDLEEEKIVQVKTYEEYLKEKAAMDCQRQLLLHLKEEVDEMSERLASERSVYVAEQCNLQELLGNLQFKQEVMLDTKSILEAEIEALRILRSWVEDEARKSQARARVLEEVGRSSSVFNHALAPVSLPIFFITPYLDSATDNTYMIVRLGFLVAASVAAFAAKQLHVKTAKSTDSSAKRSENGEASIEQHQIKGDDREQFTYFDDSIKEKDVEEEEEEEEVKLINSIFNHAQGTPPGMEDEDILPEFEDLLSGEIDYPLPGEKFDQAEKDKIYETEMANNASELECLRNLVRELEEREVKLEGELLEYYGLKEQESDVVELQRQLKIKTVEIDMLNITINSLQAERKKLQEEISHGASSKKELELARNKIKELQRQIQLDANQTKGQLLLLKQQVSGLQAKEQEAVNKDAEVETRLKAVKELEVVAVELKRKNKELQHEKRELIIKLGAAEAKLTSLSNLSETEMVAKVREEVNNLKHANEDLLKQVEGLQMNRFSEVEELVYLRWVNACLRYELRNYQTPSGKVSARDLNKSLSPKSQERAKQLLLEYAGSERGQGDTDMESNYSHPSSPGSEDFDNTSIDSSSSRYSFSKKPNLIQKLKKWGRSKDDSSAFSSPSRSFSGVSPSRSSMSHRPRGPLESLMIRNASDTVAITSFGKMDQDAPDSPGDSLNSVASSFQVMSKSVEGVLDEKYPAYKDRHKLALEREKHIKEKAEKARAVKFGDSSNFQFGTKGEKVIPITLPAKLSQIKEKPVASGESGEQSSDGKDVDSQTVSKMKFAHIEKRPPRVPRPPPKSSAGAPVATNANPSGGVPPPPGAPPPPPPPPGGPPRPPPPPGSLPRGAGSGDKVHRAPELVEFYQSLMKREAKKDTSSLISSTSNVSDARSNMIGEIENRSSFLLAVKADVETQGDFVQSLATEVRAASFSTIDDLVAFVNWLDEELSFLVDERAVLKHFDWPESKADALREAAFEYQDLMKLERQVTSFVDDPNLPCEAALKKMYKLLEKVENSVYALLRTRDMAVSRYREFGIPTNWLLDSGVVGKIKLSSVQLARKYMKRVASELDTMSGPEKEPNREFLVLQGVRFAFRVHQFAGGFDAESMKAFEELRSRVRSQMGEENKMEGS
ncbi:hypothetical protein D5086_020056 [Populus alba]|uniref:Uncharacterized protein n=1 Tax=Populus alba TaxID=43335 RepID=A0ACC4BJM0_POPAL